MPNTYISSLTERCFLLHCNTVEAWLLLPVLPVYKALIITSPNSVKIDDFLRTQN